jgi:hypothetical protein
MLERNNALGKHLIVQTFQPSNKQQEDYGEVI